MKTDLFLAYEAADAAYTATVRDVYNTEELAAALAAGKAFDKAWEAYLAGESAAKAKWDAIPESDAKYSAEDNANDTVADGECDVRDRLRWYEIAVNSYNLI